MKSLLKGAKVSNLEGWKTKEGDRKMAVQISIKEKLGSTDKNEMKYTIDT